MKNVSDIISVPTHRRLHAVMVRYSLHCLRQEQRVYDNLIAVCVTPTKLRALQHGRSTIFRRNVL